MTKNSPMTSSHRKSGFSIYCMIALIISLITLTGCIKQSESSDDMSFDLSDDMSFDLAIQCYNDHTKYWNDSSKSCLDNPKISGCSEYKDHFELDVTNLPLNRNLKNGETFYRALYDNEISIRIYCSDDDIYVKKVYGCRNTLSRSFKITVEKPTTLCFPEGTMVTR